MTNAAVAKSADVGEGATLAVRVAGKAVLLARIKGEVRAVENRCPHLGLPLTRGRVSDGAIRCPFHGSSFDLCSGANLDWVNSVAGLSLPVWSRTLIALGRQPAPLQTYRVRESGGEIYVDTN